MFCRILNIPLYEYYDSVSFNYFLFGAGFFWFETWKIPAKIGSVGMYGLINFLYKFNVARSFRDVFRTLSNF